MTTKLSKSPERNTFQKKAYLDRCFEDGVEPSEAYLEVFDQIDRDDEEWAKNPELYKNDLEYELRSTEWILDKVRADERYAQNLYAALCNNAFRKNDVWPILKKERWSCSWRYAGGIIADMQEKGDYINWYCSGMVGELSDEEYNQLSKEEQENYIYAKNNFVGEGLVTDEICNDLLTLGWLVVDDDTEE